MKPGNKKNSPEYFTIYLVMEKMLTQLWKSFDVGTFDQNKLKAIYDFEFNNSQWAERDRA